MHFGRLPAGPGPGLRLAPIPENGWTRRRLAAVGIGSAVAGFGAWGYLERVQGADRRGPARRPPREPDAALQRGTLPWALAQLDAEPDVLLPAAGDLERVAARHAREVRLVPVFARLLDVALVANVPFADAAAACAVRALDLLAAASLLVPRRHALAARAEFTQTRKEFDYVLGHLARSAGR